MNPVIKCFVCHVKTDDWRNDLCGLKSQHSCTFITDFMRKILGDFNLSRNIDDVQNCICADCLNRFEEYDWTCTMVKQQEKELYDLLIKSDKLCDAELNRDIGDIGSNVRIDKSIGDDPLIDFTEQSNDELTGDDEMIKVMVEPLDVLIPQDKESDEEFDEHNMDNGAIYNQPEDPDFTVKIEDDSSCEDNEDYDYIPQKRTIKAKRAKPQAKPQQVKKDDGELSTPKKRGRKPKNKDLTEETKPRKKREKRSYECKDCEQVFHKLVEYVAHRKWHREQLIPEFRCSKCFYISENQEAFEAHAKLHENVPALQCVFCNLTFTFKGTLTKHTRIHSNQRNYQCTICGKTFLRSISLNTHMKYHLNMKTKQCPHCPLAFVETKNLTRHLKTHTLEKPYSCSICGRRFAYSYNVRPHEQTHTDRNVYRKFKCTVTDCKSAFDSKAKLNTHLQKSHAMTSLIYENTNNPSRLGS
ncbi:zinc finger protein 699-like [Contarinia nasturtii]|uniref:zinc finger protein 699-like n=1 Tax=Contarinia nasturtii TaxID=265458 RepID=UPI0012D4265D|nr:zinc finger protein 699-like [Contarinia nasturtii]